MFLILSLKNTCLDKIARRGRESLIIQGQYNAENFGGVVKS